MHGIYRHSNNCTCSILFFGHCTQRMHLHPGISPLAARSCLAARATDAKIRLWRIKHRRVQTAAVGLCRGVYVFVGRVLLRIMFRRGLTAAVVQKKPPYRLQRIVRYDGSVIIIIWQRLPQPQALRPLEVLLLPRMSVLGKVL